MSFCRLVLSLVCWILLLAPDCFLVKYFWFGWLSSASPKSCNVALSFSVLFWAAYIAAASCLCCCRVLVRSCFLLKCAACIFAWLHVHSDALDPSAFVLFLNLDWPACMACIYICAKYNWYITGLDLASFSCLSEVFSGYFWYTLVSLGLGPQNWLVQFWFACL